MENKDRCLPSQKGKKQNVIVKWLPLDGLIICAFIAMWAYRNELLTDKEKLEAFVQNAGVLGFFIFIGVQIIQVIIPILPGGVTCLVGSVMYGPFFGFIANYIGICVGSLLGFVIAKIYGRQLLFKLFGEEKLARFDKWTKEKKTFSVMFAVAMLLPGLPDDMICYLAGTTDMSFRRFCALLFSAKVFPIAIYGIFPSFFQKRV